MASLNKNALGSDDEDDLESLRLAALKSLKPKSAFETQHKPLGISHCKLQHPFNKPSTFGAAQTTRHHNRGFRNNGRIGRNGINPRVRTNTNLISIQTIDPDEPKEVKIPSLEVPKLILPQDRYHKPLLIIENTQRESSGNKFDRYDNSEDDSESDSDELAIKSSRRERKNSVELLMDQLENEINLLDGKEEPKPKEEDRISDNEDDYGNEINVNKSESDGAPSQNDTLIIVETDPDLVQIDEPVSPVKGEKLAILDTPPSPTYKKSRSQSPFAEKSLLQKRKSRTRSRSRSPFLNQYKSPYRSPKRSRSPPRKVRYSPNPYPRVLSPLTLNTEVLNTITMAPLSPRSAAFVLENRQILARRQMSPRRSLSRESSCRRSLTPKRLKSPRRRSRSPIKRSLSPRKRSLSPRRRSNSPRNNYHRRSPNCKPVKRGSNSPVVASKHPIHKRLGSRPNSRNVSPYVDRKTEIPTAKKKRSRSLSLSLSPSPDRNYHKRPLNETTGHVNNDARNRREKTRKESPKPEPKSKENSVLEARRRKFESPVQINNGIIKLKSSKGEDETKEDSKSFESDKEDKVEESPEEKDFEDEEEELEENEEILDLNPTLDDLWSDDDETDDENEGRFKSKPSLEKKSITILPFRKLTERPIPTKSLLPRDDNDHRDRRYKRQRRRRSRSPLKTIKSEPKKESENRDRVQTSKPAAEKLRSKPVEEDKKKDKCTVTVKSETNKSTDILKPLHSDKNIKRKVKIQKLPETGNSNVETIAEPEIVIENEEEVVANKEDDGGDLRAELSRRRAQRLIKAGSLAEALPARLLKNALQEVVPKRSAIKQPKITKGSGSSADRRVLILKRLASSPAPQLEPAIKVANKECKLPIHMRLGSNPDVEEPVRSERRNKRSRTSRRKKQVQV